MNPPGLFCYTHLVEIIPYDPDRERESFHGASI